MKVYTYSEARQHLAELLEQAQREGGVRVRRRDGRVFVITPVAEGRSPFDVPGAELGLTTEEVVDLVREGRRPA